jgi:hypothetical protein
MIVGGQRLPRGMVLGWTLEPGHQWMKSGTAEGSRCWMKGEKT